MSLEGRRGPLSDSHRSGRSPPRARSRSSEDGGILPLTLSQERRRSLSHPTPQCEITPNVLLNIPNQENVSEIQQKLNQMQVLIQQIMKDFEHKCIEHEKRESDLLLQLKEASAEDDVLQGLQKTMGKANFRRMDETQLLSIEQQLKTYLSDIEEIKSEIRSNELKSCMCCVCLERKKSVLFLPCRHLCTCAVCCLRLTKCPLCDAKITQKLEAYT